MGYNIDMEEVKTKHEPYVAKEEKEDFGDTDVVGIIKRKDKTGKWVAREVISPTEPKVIQRDGYKVIIK